VQNAWSRGGNHESSRNRFVGDLNQPLIVEIRELLRPNAAERGGTHRAGRGGAEAGSARRTSWPTATQQEHVCVRYIKVLKPIQLDQILIQLMKKVRETERERESFIRKQCP